ncbi:MAG: Fe-S oxidoreductase, partial [Halobacteriales archaeon]|nr:Fe-S oxidoreductase [Halobacteriales archaeon]
MPTTPADAAVTRPVFWGIGPVGEAVFYYLAAVALALFAVGVWGRFSRYSRGAPDPTPRLDRLPTRVVSAARLVVTNARQFDRDRYAGLMHTLVVWGFLTLLIGTTILAIDMELYQPLTGRSFFVGTFYLSYSFVMDAMGLLFVVGVGMALYRRYVVRVDRLHGPHTGAPDHLFVWSLFLLGTGGYLLEGVRIRAMGFPPFETVSFVGWFVAETLAVGGVSPGAARAAYPALWWSHALVALAFVAAVPHAKFLHLVSSFANLVARDDRAGVRLPRVPEDTPPEAIGPSDIDDFSWKQLLD